MSDSLDWVSLIAGSAFALFWRYLDFKQTKYVFPRFHITEENPFVMGEKKAMSEPKAWLGLAIPFVLGYIASLVLRKQNTGTASGRGRSWPLAASRPALPTIRANASYARCRSGGHDRGKLYDRHHVHTKARVLLRRR